MVFQKLCSSPGLTIVLFSDNYIFTSKPVLAVVSEEELAASVVTSIGGNRDGGVGYTGVHQHCFLL